MSTLPEWLPDAIRAVVNGRSDLKRFPVGERLLTDERMKQVWKTLNAEGLRCARDDPDDFEGRLNKLPERYQRETPPPDSEPGFWETPPESEPGFSWLSPALAAELAGRNMSVDEVDRADALYRRKRRDAYLANSAGASFFLATAIIFTLRNRTVKEYDIEQEAWRWQTGAALCREALSSPHRATVDPALAAALSMSADYFDGHATSIGTGATASYYVIKRNSRLRAPGEDENIRGQVREVAAVTKKIFGRALYGTVATAASVATDLKISGNNAEKWCADLPAPLRNELSRRDIPQHRRSP